MSSVSLLRSVASEQAGTSKSTIWRTIKAGRFPAARARGLKELLAALQRGDHATAHALARPLADQGLAVAQLVLGVMYGGGHGVPQNYAEAAKWRHRAADQGRPEAQTILGVMYAKGQGVAQNDAKAAKWFRKAADQGHATAQSNLGLMYAQGHGVAQNDAEALTWFRKAADQGLAEAQTILGAMHVKGQGVAQNYILAHMWFNLAAARGDAGAVANRDHLARMMTPAQIAEAQRLAQEWKPTK
jgi:uncharacterized protein